MDLLKDGQYRTWPNWSPETESNIRVVKIEAGVVQIGSHGFTQSDFFNVNKLAPAADAVAKIQAVAA